MLYDLSLKIKYEYQSPAGSSRHMLRVVPRDIPGCQRAIATELSITPQPAEMSVFEDAFGNKAYDVLLRGEHSVLEISLRSRLERFAPARREAADLSLGQLPQAIASVHSVGADAPHHFLGRSRLIRPSRTTTGFAMDAIGDATNVREAIHRIGHAINSEMTFDANATEVDTPHEVAFQARRGVCQDFSHIMIACLRGIGIPAGYVSGFLRTIPPPGAERLAGADAMHAWVKAWCGPVVGWIEYDPTNALDIQDQHVVVSYGRDYADVSPVKGMLRSFGTHHSSQAVDLVEVVVV